MVITVDQLFDSEEELENLVTRVFFKELDLLGGLKKLTEYRTLTWLPSLARASYAIVLKEEYMKTDEEIAEKIGLTKNTVRNILRADPELAMKKIENFDELTEEEKKELKVHTAGGLAKLAYKLVKEGQEAQVLLDFCGKMGAQVAEVCDVPWAYMVLKKLKGTKYPVESYEILAEKLKGIDIKGKNISDIIQKIDYPIKSPANLLHEIKKVIES